MLLNRKYVQTKADASYQLGLATDAEELGSSVEIDDKSINISAVEEYSKEDMRLRTEQMIGLYNPSIFAFCFYPSVDIVHLMQDLDLLPPLRPEASVAHWMADPKLVLRQPRVLADVMGEERWEKLRAPLAELAENLTEFSPLVRCVKKYRLPRQKWLPCLRQLAVEESTTADKTFIPAFCLSMCNGRLSDDWRLPTDPTQRTEVVCELLLALAAETGALNIGTTACMIIRLHRITMTFPLQKLLMCSFAAHGRKQLDWDARTNGALVVAIGRWKAEYFKIVENDLDAAASGLTELSGDELVEEDADEEDEDALNDDGEVVKRRRRKVEEDEDESLNSLEQFEERNASAVGISADDLEDEAFDMEGKGEEDGELVTRKGRKLKSKNATADDDDDEESDEMSRLAATDAALEGVGGGGGVDEEYDDEEVFVDPNSKADVSTYFTSGTQLTRAQSLSTTTTSPAIERKQQKRNENMRRRLLSRITSQMAKKKGSLKKNVRDTSKKLSVQSKKRNVVS